MRESVQAYGAPGVDGGIAMLLDGEYIQTEKVGDGRSVVWSSTAPLVTIVSRVTELIDAPLGGDDERSVVAVTSLDSPNDYELGDGAAQDVIDFIASEPQREIRFVNINFGDFTLVWRRPFKKLTGSKLAFAETGVTGNLDHVDISALVKKTGSVHLALRAEKLYAQVRSAA